MPSRRSARRTFHRIVAVSGALLCASAVALPSFSLPSAAAVTPRASASGSWRIYLDRQWVDAQGLPVAEPASALPAGAALTISSGGTSATCTFAADGLACTYGDGGFVVAKGASYTVTASGLEHFRAANVGTFTTGLDVPGPQCTPNHGGLLDPCRHTVALAAPAVVVDPAPDAEPDTSAAPATAAATDPAPSTTTSTTGPAATATTVTTPTDAPVGASSEVLPGDPQQATGPATETLTVERTSARVPTPDSASFAFVLAGILVFVVGLVAFGLAVTHRHDRRPRGAR